MWATNPVIEFLGYESWMAPVVTWWMPWEQYATQIYPGLSEGAAWLWTVVFAIAVVGVILPGRQSNWLIYPGIILLLLDAIMSTAGEYYWVGSILDKILMWLTPICYLSAIYAEDEKKWLRLARYGVSIVFLVHGLYALEVMPRPGYWTEMVSTAIGVTNQAATWMLWVIGVLDILAALFFLVIRPVPALVWYYLIGWGLLTALGRLIGFVHVGTWYDLLINWSYETLIRLPHGLVPLAMFVQIKRD